MLQKQNAEIFLASEMLYEPNVPFFFALSFNKVA